LNITQVIEGLISKTITKAEEEILQDTRYIPTTLKKLSTLASSLGDPEYSQAIYDLSEKIKRDSVLSDEFIASIRDLGLFFEGQNFATFDEHRLYDTIEKLFGVTPNEPIIIKRETLQFLKDKINIDISLPNNDIILDNIFAAPIYYLKLKQEAESKLSSRDFGNYKAE